MSAPFTDEGKTPGQVAYEAWSRELESGLEDMWEELSGSYEGAWEAIANAVLESHSLCHWALRTAVDLARKHERTRVLEEIRAGKIDINALMAGPDERWEDEK